MAILVTGGAGFIGSHTCVELLQAGKELVIFDNFSNSKPEALNRIEKITGKCPVLFAGDLCHADAVEAVFEKYAIESVVHFAGLKAVGESVELPLLYYACNLTGTINLCRTMARHGCKKLVFSSSATVYGTNPDVPFREDYPLSTTNPYGSTKLMIETILGDLCRSDPAWSVVLLRYFNPIGAHPSGLLGEDPNGIPNNLLPFICQVATGKRQQLHVFGNDYNTPDGTGVRDYIHVVDLALGHLKALEYAETHTGAEAFNLGSGHGSSVLEVVSAFEKASGHTIPYSISPRREGDIATSYANAQKANQILGWHTTRGLDEMCADSWNFIRQNPNGL